MSIFVAGGHINYYPGLSSSTGMINFSGRSCRPLHLPFAMQNSVQGLKTKSGEPLICGKTIRISAPAIFLPSTSVCIKYVKDTNRWEVMANFTELEGAYALPLSNGSYWIVGGEYHPSSSYLFNGEDAMVEGPPLMENFAYSCALQISENKTLLVSINAYVFNHEDGSWTQLPDFRLGELNSPVSWNNQACGVIRDEYKTPKYAVFAGGNFGRASRILDLASLTWIVGPDLPFAIRNPSSLSYKDTFLFLGGHAFYNNPVLDGTGRAHSRYVVQFDPVNIDWIVRPERGFSTGLPYAVWVENDAIQCY